MSIAHPLYGGLALFSNQAVVGAVVIFLNLGLYRVFFYLLFISYYRQGRRASHFFSVTRREFV